MNIIKFKDDIVNGRDWYNNNLRGKYAYWVRCQYALPFDGVSQNDYIRFEQDITALVGSGLTYIDIHNETWIADCIDNTNTTKVNSIYDYKSYNDYVPSVNLDMEDLKKFRTWIATSMLNINYDFYYYENDSYIKISTPSLQDLQDAVEYNEIPESQKEDVIKIKSFDSPWSEDDQHMLSYYSNGMYDDTLKWVSVFNNFAVTYSNGGSSCACGCNTNISSLYKDNVTVCDSVMMYRDGIKGKMISLFSNTETWSSLPTSYLSLFKMYIDGIIQANLPLTESNSSNYYKCECLNKSGQGSAMITLNQLSDTLGYIINDEISGHKNFISTTLNEWSSNLYELMEW